MSEKLSGILHQMSRVEYELNQLVLTPGLDDALAHEAATISEAFRNRRHALERIREQKIQLTTPSPT